ncbi:hypothetical protein F5Y16DRAFT_425395 [Xylariaceae sp. FL0255]|nr:hypothetical protein F5Y16DRAFT_425395 [Xylariaceae sp. FL0255]
MPTTTQPSDIPINDGSEDVPVSEISPSSQSIQSVDEVTEGVGQSQCHNDTTITVASSLGLANLCIIIGGTLISMVTLSLLVFLWVGRGQESDGQTASYSWRKIMLSGRLNQVITISSLIIRSSISMQAAICTSLVSALILERRAVPLSRVAPLSALRSVNGGPFDLFKQIISRKSSLFYTEARILLILALASFATQFSSTILLSDLDEISLAGFPHRVNRNFSLNPTDDLETIGLSLAPRDYSLFGTLPTAFDATPNSKGVSDTGVKRQAMLPFSQAQDRESIRAYAGPSIVFSSRVMCMPPVIRGHIGLRSDDVTLEEWGQITGQLHLDETLSNAGLIPQDICDLNTTCKMVLPIECAVPGNGDDNNDIALALCHVKSNPENLTTSDWKISMSPWISAATISLLSSTNIGLNKWGQALGSSSIPLPQPQPQPQTREEWVNFDFLQDFFVNSTLCFGATNALLSNVSMSTNRTLTEPVFSHNDTTNIQIFYGADPTVQNLGQRGLLAISHIHNDTDHIYGATGMDPIPINDLGASNIDWDMLISFVDPNTTLLVCEACVVKYATGMASEYAQTFSDIIKSTSRASVAMQTLYSMFAVSLHDQSLPFFTIGMPVEVVQVQSVTIPIRYMGLIIVAAFVLIDVICIVTITSLYLHHCRYSLVGNYWHVISQATSNSSCISDMVLYGNMRKDDEISQVVDQSDISVRLMKLPGSDLVGIMDVEHNPLTSQC